MNKVVAIIISLCLVLQCAVQLGVVGMYRLNKSYIAKNLCENRDKPRMGCNGKCQLKKQLKNASQQQEKESKRGGEEVAVATVFILPGVWQPSPEYSNDVLRHVSYYSAPQGFSFSADILRPPQV